jgi:hypothetical protein
MCNCHSIREVLGSTGYINMDPVVITSHPRKIINHELVDDEPVTGAK